MNFRVINYALLGLSMCFCGALEMNAQGRGGQGGNSQGGRGSQGGNMQGGNNMMMQQGGMQGNNMMMQGGNNMMMQGGNNMMMQGGNNMMMQQGGFNNNMRTQNNMLPTSAPFPYPETEIDENGEFQGPFYFVDESPIQILKILEILTGKSILQPPNLPNVKVNFTSKDKIATADAILLLESLLSMNGIAIIPMGDVLKAVSISGVNTQSPEFLDGDVLSMPASQKFYTKMYNLEYTDISSAQTLLSGFITPSGVATFVVFQRTNSFLLTDTLANHQRMQRLLNQIDREIDIAEEMAFIELKNTSASDMQSSLKSISGNLLKKYFENTIIEADDRTNQLIIFTRKGNLKYIKKFVEGFDIEAEPLTKSEVFYIKHSEAEDVATAINSIIDGQQNTAKTLTETQAVTRDSTIDVRRNSTTNLETGETYDTYESFSPDVTTTTTIEQQQRELMFSKYVTLVSDERSNSIIVHGTKSDIKNVKELIDKIDVVLRQVKIDIIISEVKLEENEVLSNVELEGKQHFSEPPLRYSEARLIKEMEENGIGRPSTYASIIDTLQARSYVELKKQTETGKTKVFFPTEQGTLTDVKLQEFFKTIINVKYTAEMELNLDKIAEGILDNVEELQEFYDKFMPLLEKANKGM